MTPTIWHNPRCSKSRTTLTLLQEKGIAPDILLYLTEPPSVDEIKAVLAWLDIPAIGLVRTGEKVFREAGLSKTASDDALIAAMAAHPILIERPVVIAGDAAAIGRPPEAVLDLFKA